MSERDNVLRKIREQYPRLAREYGVQRIGLFGSVARGAASADSDVDLVVEFGKPIGLRFVEFVEFMEKLLSRKVDVLTKEGVKNIRVTAVLKEIEKDIVYV